MCIDEHKLLHGYVEAKWERVLVGAATGAAQQRLNVTYHVYLSFIVLTHIYKIHVYIQYIYIYTYKNIYIEREITVMKKTMCVYMQRDKDHVLVLFIYR